MTNASLSHMQSTPTPLQRLKAWLGLAKGLRVPSQIRRLLRGHGNLLGGLCSSTLGLNVLHSSLDGILCKHAAMKLHRWQAQVLGNVLVLDLRHLKNITSPGIRNVPPARECM